MSRAEVADLEKIAAPEKTRSLLTKAHFQRLFTDLEPNNLPPLAEGSPRAVAATLYDRYHKKRISYVPHAERLDFQTVYRKEEAFETTMRSILEEIEKKNPEMDFRQRRTLNTEIVLAYWLALGGGIEEIRNTESSFRRSRLESQDLEQQDDSHLAMAFLEAKMTSMQENATGVSQGYEVEIINMSDSHVVDTLNVCRWHNQDLPDRADISQGRDKKAANVWEPVLFHKDISSESAKKAAQNGAVGISTLASLGICTTFIDEDTMEFQTTPSFSFDLQMTEIEYILRSRAYLLHNKSTELINVHASYGVELSPDKTEAMDVRAMVEASGVLPTMVVNSKSEVRTENYGKVSSGGVYFPFFLSKDVSTPGIVAYPDGNTIEGITEFRSFSFLRLGEDTKAALKFMHAAALCIDAVHKKDQENSPLVQAWTDLMRKWTSIFTNHFPDKDYPGNGEGERFISFEEEYVNREGERFNTRTEEFRVPAEKKGTTNYEKLLTLLTETAQNDKSFASEVKNIMQEFSAKVKAIQNELS